MPFTDFLPLIGTALSSVSSGVGAAIQRGQAKRDLEDTKAYNHPKAALARISEAGLPFAPFTGG